MLNIIHLFPYSHSWPLSAILHAPKDSSLHSELLQALLDLRFQLDLASGRERQKPEGGRWIWACIVPSPAPLIPFASSASLWWWLCPLTQPCPPGCCPHEAVTAPVKPKCPPSLVGYLSPVHNSADKPLISFLLLNPYCGGGILFLLRNKIWALKNLIVFALVNCLTYYLLPIRS